jgi:oligo-1,6-glucosidase
LFTKEQADLNYHNKEVIEEVKNILRHYLEMGVVGFRCDVINLIYKTSLENGKFRFFICGRENYKSQEENFEILAEFRRVLEEY